MNRSARRLFVVEQSLWSKIIERRLLPLLAGYFGLMWALVQFLSFMVERYGWPDRSIDLLLTAMISGAPLAVLLIWRIGAPGPATFSGLDRLLVGLFALLCAGSVGWRYVHAPPQQIAAAVALEPPAEAAAPQARREDQVSDVLIYTFDVAGAPNDAWLQFGLPLLAEYDLFFDGRFAARSALSNITPTLSAFLERNGINEIAAAPTAVRRRAAVALGFRALVGGRIVREGTSLRIDVDIHRLRPDATLGPFVLTARDEWDAINQLAALIRAELAPAKAIAQANDPDIRSVTTESLDAAKAYVDGNLRTIVGSDRIEGTKAFELAQSIDPSFLIARYLSVTVNPSYTMREGLPALEAMLPQLDVLPTNFRYMIQRFIAQARGDKPGERQVLETWARTAPWDRAPRLALAELRLGDDPGSATALEEIKTLTLESGSASELSSRAGLFLRQQRIDDALMLAEKALLLDPTSYPTLLALAAIESARGGHERAADYLGQARATRPDLISADIERARIRFGLGEVDAAIVDIEKLLERKLDNRQRDLVMGAKIELLISLGRVRAARAAMDVRSALPVAQPDSVAVERFLPYVSPLVTVLGEDAVRAWFAAAPAASPALQPYIDAYVELEFAYARGNGAEIAAQLDRLLAFYRSQTQMVDERRFALAKIYAKLFSRPASYSVDELASAVADFEKELRAGLHDSDQHRALIEAASRFALNQGRADVVEKWLTQPLIQSPGAPMLRVLDAWRQAVAGERTAASTVADELRPIVAKADIESDLAKRFADLEAALR